MTITPEIHFDSIDASEAVAERIRQKTARLAKRFDRLTHLRATIAAPHKHGQKDKVYQVKLLIGVPGRSDLAVSSEGSGDHAHEDVHLAVRDAFETAERRLSELFDKMRGDVKSRGG
ncbi:MAG: HPF/RaiA family ribosome-associated protein [Hyphomicrobiaceae bacterium]